MNAIRLILAIALLPASALQATAQPSAEPPATQKALIIELTIPAPLPEVWDAFTTTKGLSTWLAPDVNVDLRPGGDWIVHFPTSTGGGTILSFVPRKELVISALAPDKFPAVRAARTRAVFSFEPRGNSTLVRLTQTGWQSGPEWDAAYEYLASGNAQLLAALHHRFVSGPIDWDNISGTATPKAK
ncbi:MAG TPA: SRPBCC domain-containing protein [Acidobacteriaceae bacterium]